MKECQRVEVKWINEVNGHYNDENFLQTHQNLEIPDIEGMNLYDEVADAEMLDQSQNYDMTAHIEVAEDEEQDSDEDMNME